MSNYIYNDYIQFFGLLQESYYRLEGCDKVITKITIPLWLATAINLPPNTTGIVGPAPPVEVAVGGDSIAVEFN